MHSSRTQNGASFHRHISDLSSTYAFKRFSIFNERATDIATHFSSCAFERATPSIARALNVTNEERRRLWEIAGAQSLSSLAATTTQNILQDGGILLTEAIGLGDRCC